MAQQQKAAFKQAHSLSLSFALQYMSLPAGLPLWRGRTCRTTRAVLSNQSFSSSIMWQRHDDLFINQVATQTQCECRLDPEAFTLSEPKGGSKMDPPEEPPLQYRQIL